MIVSDPKPPAWTGAIVVLSRARLLLLHTRKWFGCRNQKILVGLFGWEVWLTEQNIWLLQPNAFR
jgi:hypothetical protein